MRFMAWIHRRLIKVALGIVMFLGILYLLIIMVILQHSDQLETHKTSYLSTILDLKFVSSQVFLAVQSMRLKQYVDSTSVEAKQAQIELLTKSAYSFGTAADFEFDSNRFWWIWPIEQNDWISKAEVLSGALDQIRNLLKTDESQNFLKVQRTLSFANDNISSTHLLSFQNIALEILKNKHAMRVIFLTNSLGFAKLSKERDVISIFLGWDRKTVRNDHGEKQQHINDLISGKHIRYYPCTATGDHQIFSRTRSTTSIHSNYSCHSDVYILAQPEANFDPRYFTYHEMRHNLVLRDWRLYRDKEAAIDEWDISCLFCHQYPTFITYVHIIHNAILDQKGVVYTKSLKIYPLMWVGHKRVDPEILDILVGTYRLLYKDNLYTMDESLYGIEEDLANIKSSNILVANEVFSISVKFATENFGHSLLESLTRVSMCVSFLQKNPHIAIHTGNTMYLRDHIRIFGLRNELISGTVIAKRIYLPEGNAPYFPAVHYLQTTSLYARQYMQKLVTNPNELKQDTIIYVRRTIRRNLKQDKSLDGFLTKTARDYNLKYVRYSDVLRDGYFDMNETMVLFHKAVLIIGAHGAGLSNILFSQPITSVIEIQCPPPWTASTFRHVAYKLGMRFHSIMGHPRDGVDPLSARPNTVHCDEGLKIHNMDYLRKTVDAMLKMTLTDLKSTTQ